VGNGQGIFVSDVDIALFGPDGVGADEHALEDAMRISLHQASIHVGARVSLVGIADDVLQVALGLPRQLPFQAGQEAGPTAAAEA
jgi:hypothetical protein